MHEYENFNDCYLDLASLIINEPQYISSPRGSKIKERLVCTFKIKNPRDRMLFVPKRKFSVHYLVAELLWYLSGENKTEWISNYSSFWKNISDDGETANSAYGARIFKTNSAIASSSIVQWDYIKNELIKDSDSRRAVIHIRSAWDSFRAKLDVPCTLTLQFFIRDKKLHMVVNMRSSDLILGIAYDIPAFTIMQELLALELGVGIGEYIHTSNSLHIYERHFDMAKEMISDSEQSKAKHLHAKFGQMPSMPSMPPTDRLFAIEANLRIAKNNNDINQVLVASKDLEPYWFDWVKVLASHRCKKLKDNDTSIELINSTSYAGFHSLKD
jgi:thymidylate synthase|tara:strand:- start:1084 stop:2067 length:984 start_codon:yes stop_codon:yes gene_type:complete